MKKSTIALAVLAGGAILAAGCQGRASVQETDGFVEGIVDEIMTHAAEEIKGAVADEVWEFFADGDFAARIGISGEEHEKIKNNIKNYIENYGSDEKKLVEAKEAVEALLENAEGMSVESIEEKLSEIFK